MQADPDPFQSWLDDFRRGVDETLSRSEPPASPVARDAQEAFQNWWRAEHEPIGAQTGSLLAEPPASGEDRLLPPDWPVQVERLSYAKAALEQKLGAEAARGKELEGFVASLERRLAEARVQQSKLQQKLDAASSELQARALAAGEHARALSEVKGGLEASVARQSQELARLSDELELERGKGLLADKQGALLAKHVEELERERARLRERLAAQDGALEELRRQATGYQQRLVEAKELTDADIALMRQDLKLFMEELKIIRNTIKKGA